LARIVETADALVRGPQPAIGVRNQRETRRRIVAHSRISVSAEASAPALSLIDAHCPAPLLNRKVRL
jgi:hypothetical protein